VPNPARLTRHPAPNLVDNPVYQALSQIVRNDALNCRAVQRKTRAVVAAFPYDPYSREWDEALHGLAREAIGGGPCRA
jgi:hypothetical protein